MIHTQTEIDNLVELAIIQRAELKKLVESLPQLRDHLSSEIERNLEEIEPAIRSELEQFVTARALDAHAQTSTALTAKLDELARSLETTTAARYSVLIAEREKNESLLTQAEARIAEAASALPGSVKEIVAGELARFPRAGEIDQLRKEFAEPKGLNPRGKWVPDETYQRLDLVTVNGDSFVSNIDGNRERPSRSAADWTLNAARGNSGGGGGVTSLTDLLPIPTSGQILGSEGTSYVPKTLVAGSNITITETPTQITITGDEGQIELQDGTAAAPSLFFVNDTDTGLFRVGANTLGIAVGGAQAAAISSGTFAITPNTTIAGTLTANGTSIPASKTLVVTTDKISVLAATTSAELAGVISDETGTGSLVFASSPTLTSPALGTPTALIGTNITGTGSGFTAGNVTTNANLTGDVTSVGNATSIAAGVIVDADVNASAAIAYSKLNLATSIVNADISASAAIVDTKLATISTASKVSNSATTATSANTASAIVARDGSGNFTAGTITANLTGNVSGSSGSTTGNAATATALATGRTIAITGDLAYTSPSFDGTGNVTAAGTLATVATAGSTGSSTAIPIVTINAKGLTTSISTAAVVAPAGTLSGNTLASGVTASSLTSLGTIASLTATAGTISTTPSASTDIANKLYVDTVAQGLDAKASCVAATTANITLSGTQTVDGIVLIAANRVLVKDQTLSQNNGIYLCAAGAWTRTTDADTWDELTSAFTFIEQGTVNADCGFVCTANAGGTLGTTALPWSQFSGAGTFTAGTGLTLTGSVFSLTSPVAVANGGTGLTSLGSGVATFLGTPSSANLAAAVSDETGTGALVFATSPTLVTPALGTPSALVGTNITGTASGLTAGNVTTNANLTGAITSVGNATSLGSFTSANLASALTDETGSGANVFATSPTLVTPILGTPSSGTLTSCTGLPISTGVSGLGTGVATALAVNVGSAGAPVVNGGALGTPSGGTVTNLTGTASININGTVGATTPSTVAATSVTASAAIITSSDIAAQSGGLFVGSSAKQLYLRTVSGVNRIDSYDNPITATVPLNINSSELTLQIADTTRATLTSTGLNSTAIGATTVSTGAFSTLSATGVASFLGLKAQKATATSGFISAIDEGANVYNVLGSRNNADSAYLPLVIRGTTVTLGATSDIAAISSTGLAVTGALSCTTNAELATTGGGNFVKIGSSTAIGSGTGLLEITFNNAYYGQRVKTSNSGGGSVLQILKSTGAEVGLISHNDTTTTYATSSDYRLKDITGPLANSGTFIDALKPKVGTWKSDGSKFVGFIAHEFAEVSPSSVVGEKDAVDAEGNPKYQGMQASSSEVIANLVAELQSVRQRLAALESK